VEDPDQYFLGQNLLFNCAVNTTAPAVLDTAHRSYLNYEIYYFSDEAARERFAANPAKYCGILTDPITRQRFKPVESSPNLVHDGRPYYFLSDSTKTVFSAMPDMYARPSHQMLSKADSVVVQSATPH